MDALDEVKSGGTKFLERTSSEKTLGHIFKMAFWRRASLSSSPSANLVGFEGRL
jgi:hypothetical protein